jgi:hypothetical protein
MKKSTSSSFVFAACLVAILVLCGCTPKSPVSSNQFESSNAAPVVEPTMTVPLPATVIDEWVAPNAEPAAEPDCTQQNENGYQDPRGGYCFIFPSSYVLTELTEGLIIMEGPALNDDSPEPLKVEFSMLAQSVSSEANLSRLVDAYLTQSFLQDLPRAIERMPIELDGVPAEVLEDIPGRLSSRLVMTISNDTLYTLTFFPSDVSEAAEGLEELYSTITGSFLFLDNAAPAANNAALGSATYSEFDRSIRFQYDPVLALWIDTLTTTAIPAPAEDLYPDSSPAYGVFRLLGYGGGMGYQLPYPTAEARLMIFKTDDFSGYGDNLVQGYLNQKDGLSILLMGDIDPAFCANPHNSPDHALPFLPYVNSAQAFCSKPQVIDFEGGSGIRYLTAYTQDAGPIMDWYVFYTFQGLTDDGQHYVSAILPVQTGIFPLEAPGSYTPDSAHQELAKQLIALDAKPDGEFFPSLAQLDALIETLIIK